MGDKREWLWLKDRIENLKPAAEPLAVEMVYRWWRDQNNFLPWLQREYLHAAFPDYDPTADREDDAPYDVDHMVPQSDWGFNWGWREQRLPEQSNDRRESLRWVRSEIGNNIGNKWLVDGSINRSWNDISFTEKLQEINEKPAGHPTKALLDVFQKEASELWQQASPQGEQTAWALPRRETFQLAVEKRAAWFTDAFTITLASASGLIARSPQLHDCRPAPATSHMGMPAKAAGNSVVGARRVPKQFQRVFMPAHAAQRN